MYKLYAQQVENDKIKLSGNTHVSPFVIKPTKTDLSNASKSISKYVKDKYAPGMYDSYYTYNDTNKKLEKLGKLIRYSNSIYNIPNYTTR